MVTQLSHTEERYTSDPVERALGLEPEHAVE